MEKCHGPITPVAYGTYNHHRVNRGSAFFRQSVPAIGLSLERGSPRVPNDGYFYVLVGDDVKGRFRFRKDALKLYEAILEESGYRPPPASTSGGRSETVERYLDELEAYWTESHLHTKRGGKGRYR